MAFRKKVLDTQIYKNKFLLFYLYFIVIGDI